MENKKKPAPYHQSFLMKLYLGGGRHIGFRCSECGGTWLIKQKPEHRLECKVRNE